MHKWGDRMLLKCLKYSLENPSGPQVLCSGRDLIVLLTSSCVNGVDSVAICVGDSEGSCMKDKKASIFSGLGGEVVPDSCRLYN